MNVANEQNCDKNEIDTRGFDKYMNESEKFSIDGGHIFIFQQKRVYTQKPVL